MTASHRDPSHRHPLSPRSAPTMHGNTKAQSVPTAPPPAAPVPPAPQPVPIMRRHPHHHQAASLPKHASATHFAQSVERSLSKILPDPAASTSEVMDTATTHLPQASQSTVGRAEARSKQSYTSRSFDSAFLPSSFAGARTGQSSSYGTSSAVPMRHHSISGGLQVMQPTPFAGLNAQDIKVQKDHEPLWHLISEVTKWHDHLHHALDVAPMATWHDESTLYLAHPMITHNALLTSLTLQSKLAKQMVSASQQSVTTSTHRPCQCDGESATSHYVIGTEPLFFVNQVYGISERQKIVPVTLIGWTYSCTLCHHEIASWELSRVIAKWPAHHLTSAQQQEVREAWPFFEGEQGGLITHDLYQQLFQWYHAIGPSTLSGEAKMEQTLKMHAPHVDFKWLVDNFEHDLWPLWDATDPVKPSTTETVTSTVQNESSHHRRRQSTQDARKVRAFSSYSPFVDGHESPMLRLDDPLSAEPLDHQILSAAETLCGLQKDVTDAAEILMSLQVGPVPAHPARYRRLSNYGPQLHRLIVPSIMPETIDSAESSVWATPLQEGPPAMMWQSLPSPRFPVTFPNIPSPYPILPQTSAADIPSRQPSPPPPEFEKQNEEQEASVIVLPKKIREAIRKQMSVKKKRQDTRSLQEGDHESDDAAEPSAESRKRKSVDSGDVDAQCPKRPPSRLRQASLPMSVPPVHNAWHSDGTSPSVAHPVEETLAERTSPLTLPPTNQAERTSNSMPPILPPMGPVKQPALPQEVRLPRQAPLPPRTFPITVLPPPTAHALPFPPFPAPFMLQQASAAAVAVQHHHHLQNVAYSAHRVSPRGGHFSASTTPNHALSASLPHLEVPDYIPGALPALQSIKALQPPYLGIPPIESLARRRATPLSSVSPPMLLHHVDKYRLHPSLGEKEGARHGELPNTPPATSHGISPPFAAAPPARAIPEQSLYDPEEGNRTRPASSTSTKQMVVTTTSPTVCARCMKPWKGHHSQRPQVCDDQKRSDGPEPYHSVNQHLYT